MSELNILIFLRFIERPQLKSGREMPEFVIDHLDSLRVWFQIANISAIESNLEEVFQHLCRVGTSMRRSEEIEGGESSRQLLVHCILFRQDICFLHHQTAHAVADDNDGRPGIGNTWRTAYRA